MSQHGAPEQNPGFLLWRTTLSWQRRIRAALSPHDLTHVQFVLLASLWWLHDQGRQQPTQAQLAEQASTDLTMTSQVIRKLQARGLVQRQADRTDARAWRLRLTAAGGELLAVALPAVEAADQEYFAALGEQHDAFLAGLATLTTHHR